jgi:hypothetical protein
MYDIKDIPSVFERDKVAPGCEWWAEGHGTPTRLLIGVHGVHMLPEVPRTYEGVRAFLERMPQIEGIVWWYIEDTHPGSKKEPKLAMVRRSDFGLETNGGNHAE